MIVFQVSSLNFDFRFTLNEGSDYPEENTRDNEELRSTIFNHFSLNLNRKKNVW